MKTQLIFTSTNQSEKVSNESVWQKGGFFSDEKADFNIIKNFFPENTLMYVNNGYISTVKGGELAIYVQNFIIGQLIAAANSPENLEDYFCN